MSVCSERGYLAAVPKCPSQQRLVALVTSSRNRPFSIRGKLYSATEKLPSYRISNGSIGTRTSVVFMLIDSTGKPGPVVLAFVQDSGLGLSLR